MDFFRFYSTTKNTRIRTIVLLTGLYLQRTGKRPEARGHTRMSSARKNCLIQIAGVENRHFRDQPSLFVYKICSSEIVTKTFVGARGPTARGALPLETSDCQILFGWADHNNNNNNNDDGNDNIETIIVCLTWSMDVCATVVAAILKDRKHIIILERKI